MHGLIAFPFYLSQLLIVPQFVELAAVPQGATYYVTYRLVAEDQEHTDEDGVGKVTYHS